MTIKYYRKNVYGIEKEYPADSQVADALMNLNGHITITRTTRTGLEKLGHKFVEVLPPRKEKV